MSLLQVGHPLCIFTMPLISISLQRRKRINNNAGFLPVPVFPFKVSKRRSNGTIKPTSQSRMSHWKCMKGALLHVVVVAFVVPFRSSFRLTPPSPISFLYNKHENSTKSAFTITIKLIGRNLNRRLVPTLECAFINVAHERMKAVVEVTIPMDETLSRLSKSRPLVSSWFKFPKSETNLFVTGTMEANPLNWKANETVYENCHRIYKIY